MNDKSSSLPLLAWAVNINLIGECIVFATTRSKAKWIAVKSYWETYDNNNKGWPYVNISRAKQYDNNVLRFRKPQAWSEDFVQLSPTSKRNPL